jgi:AraC-like DNA-binding protein
MSVLETDSAPLASAARIGAAWHLPEVLRERGVELSDVLADADLRKDLFESLDNTITMPEFERLMLACEHWTRCDYVCLLIAQRSRLADMGAAGQIARLGATVGEGLRGFAEHFNLQSTASTVSVVTSGPFTRLVHAVSGQGITTTRHLEVGGVTIAFNILQDLCGRTWRPTVVTFASRAPSSLRPFHQHFGAPLRFDTDESALVFASHWLERPLPPVDPLVRQRVVALVRAQRAAILADFPATVRRLLRKQLILGQCSMPEVAALLGMHRRTLDRRLQRQGVSYGELVGSLRTDIARQLLRDTDLPVRQVAESLHFSSAANFATAFRRWTGVTPGEYRRRAR